MAEAVALNDIGSGYTIDELDSFDDDAELSRFNSEPAQNDPQPAAPEPEAKTDPDVPVEEKPTEPEAKTDPDVPVEEKAVEPEVETKSNQHWLPKPRFDYEVAKRREAEERFQQAREENARLEARMQAILAEREQQPAQPEQPRVQVAELEAQLADLDKQTEAARLDGNVDKAAELVAQARQIERQLYTPPEVDVARIQAEAVAQARAEIAFESAAEAIERKYPQLNPNNEAYDEFLYANVARYYNKLKDTSNDVRAMNEAVSIVFGANTPPPPSGEPAEKTPGTKTTDIKRNVEAANRIPPDVDGFDSDKAGPGRTLDPSRMSIEEFERLSDADEERLLA